MLVVLLAACFLWGGASRTDIPGLILLQPLAVACAAAILLLPGEIAWKSIHTPCIMLAALAALMVVQLIPLPPYFWASLAGHEPLSDILGQAGVAPVWRPLSVTPGYTLASLVGLTVPAAVLIGFASVQTDRTYRLLPYLLGGVVFSSLLGLGQVVGGPGSEFYRYEITNFGAAVGAFSNRNHQAAFLAMALPMLAVWAQSNRKSASVAARQWVAGASALFLILMLLLTGSRAGLVLGVVGAFLSWHLWRRRPESGSNPNRLLSDSLLRKGRIAIVAGGALFLIILIFSLDTGIDRLRNMSLSEDPRVQFFPTMAKIAGDFFPLGSGFGSFDPVFRFYEPAALLQNNYLNHAHNEVLELAITGGLPALLLAAIYVFWWGRTFLTVVRSKRPGSEMRFARLGGIMIMILLLGSIVDYPLRTPLFAALCALASGWLERGRISRG